MPRRAMIFRPVVPGRASRDLSGPLGGHSRGAANARASLQEKAVKRKVLE
jgi:hypothetical protein